MKWHLWNITWPASQLYDMETLGRPMAQISERTVHRKRLHNVNCEVYEFTCMFNYNAHLSNSSGDICFWTVYDNRWQYILGLIYQCCLECNIWEMSLKLFYQIVKHQKGKDEEKNVSIPYKTILSLLHILEFGRHFVRNYETVSTLNNCIIL